MIGIVIILFMFLTPVLFVLTVLGAIKLKSSLGNMDKEKWNQYFSKLSVKQYLMRILFFLFIPLFLISLISYMMLNKKYSNKKSIVIALFIMVFDALRMLYKLNRNQDKVVEIIFKLKNTERYASKGVWYYQKWWCCTSFLLN